MCGKYDRLNVWKRYAHIVELLNNCPSLVKINDNALVVDPSVRTANINVLVTTLKQCALDLKTASGMRGLKLVLPLKRLMNCRRYVSSAIHQLQVGLTYTVLTETGVIYTEMLLNYIKVATPNYIGGKGNGSRLFAA